MFHSLFEAVSPIRCSLANVPSVASICFYNIELVFYSIQAVIDNLKLIANGTENFLGGRANYLCNYCRNNPRCNFLDCIFYIRLCGGGIVLRPPYYFSPL